MLAFGVGGIDVQPQIREPALADGIRPMVRIGAYLGGTSLLTTTSRSISRIMIGYGLGDAAAGYYANANRLLVQPEDGPAARR